MNEHEYNSEWFIIGRKDFVLVLGPIKPSLGITACLELVRVVPILF